MRSHLSLCVNYKLTSAGRLIDFCWSGAPTRGSCSVVRFYPEHRSGVPAHSVRQTRGRLFASRSAAGALGAEDAWTGRLLLDFLPLIIPVSAALQTEGREGREGEEGEESDGQRRGGEKSMGLKSLK